MRCYTFINFYLSSIQQGIQSAHCIADMFVKYEDWGVGQGSTLLDWAKNHKTLICLNGGNAANIREVYHTLQNLCPHLKLPYASFCEDEQSLDGSMTCCGVIVPERIYEAASELRRLGTDTSVLALSGYELELATLLNQFSLAR